jgi:hypothetical protein
VPIGAALAGLLADSSIEAAILVLGIGGASAAALSAGFLVPRVDPADLQAVRREGSRPS